MDSVISRRTALGCLAAAAIPVRATAQQAPSLAALGAAKGIRFGTAVGVGRRPGAQSMFTDPAMMALVDLECAVIVAENEMKQYVIAARPDTLNFGPGDQLAAWVRQHGKTLRGHTLLWNRPEYVPKWLVDRYRDRPAGDLAKWLTTYVGEVASHFGERVHSWDVVNETVDPETGGLRDSLFQNKLGFDAVRLAYETAQAHAPHAQRVYNDYMSWGAGGARHRAGVLKLLERFRAENVPVDALGVQSHISGAPGGADEREWRAFLDDVTGLGYRLLITEFDVNDRKMAGSIADRDAQVATAARRYLELMLSYSQLDHLLCWGLVDRFSWLQSSPRPDGQPLRPLPYDADLRPKPLRAAIAAALQGAPNRPTVIK